MDQTARQRHADAQGTLVAPDDWLKADPPPVYRDLPDLFECVGLLVPDGQAATNWGCLRVGSMYGTALGPRWSRLIVATIDFVITKPIFVSSFGGLEHNYFLSSMFFDFG